jgi:hypothetical protein
MRRFNRVPGRLAVATALLALSAGCPGGPKVPGGVPGGGGGGVDPGACGGYAKMEGGAKLQAFFEATVAVEKAVMESEAYIKETCVLMGEKLGVPDEGDTATVCNAVVAALDEHMQVGVKGGAKLDVQYKPAVCEVNVDVAAQAAAKCEASASADVEVTCEGTCEGTCQGGCDGTCEGSAGTGGSGGECNGQCSGTCRGECSGGCKGHANVDASAQCEAKASVEANASAECTPPELEVVADAAIVVDKSKVDAAVEAIKVGLPRMLAAQARVTGPLGAAVTTWVASAQELKGGASALAKGFKDEALCISGQLAAAANMISNVQASVSVQVEVSASVSGSAGGGAG